MNFHKRVTYITLQKAPLDMYTQVNQSNNIYMYVCDKEWFVFIQYWGKKKTWVH